MPAPASSLLAVIRAPPFAQVEPLYSSVHDVTKDIDPPAAKAAF